MTDHIDDTRVIEEAAEHIRAGGVVVVPTETFYGLAADPLNDYAVSRLFEIKGRPTNKPVPLIAADRITVSRTARTVDLRTRELMTRFWPGSLTILMWPNITFPKMIANEEGKIGLRIPPACPARDLAALIGGLVTATSANLSGEPAPTSVGEISRAILDSVEMVIDKGATAGNKPSTVVNPVGGDLEIVREGVIPGNLLQEFFSKCLKSKVGDS